VAEAIKDGHYVPLYVLLDYPEFISLENPLEYYCLPNGCTPDYAATDSISGFIAYAFLKCYIAPDETTLHYGGEELYAARGSFLYLLEMVAENFDSDDPAALEDLVVDTAVDLRERGDDPDTWSVCAEWEVWSADAKDVCLSWRWHSKSGRVVSDPMCVYLSNKAMRNRSGVFYWIKLAHSVNEALRGRYIPGEEDEPEYLVAERAGQMRFKEA
jgi:hypothetical protein